MSEEQKKAYKPKEVTLKLEEPIEWGSEMIEELVLKRPTAKDIEHLSSNPTMKELMTIGANCARQPIAMIRKMDGGDAMALVEIVGDFLENSRRIGTRN